MRKTITILLFLHFVFPLDLLADAGPKFTRTTLVCFIHNGSYLEDFDSAFVIFHNPEVFGHEYDTIYIHSSRNYHEQSEIAKHNGQIEIIQNSNFDYMIIGLKFNDSIYMSSRLKYNWGREYYKLQLSQKSMLIDYSPIFHVKWYKYFLSLILTIIFELIILRLFLGRQYSQSKMLILLIIIANLISHPTLWYIYGNSELPLVLLEFGVFAFEGIFLLLTYKYRLGNQNVFEYSALSNLTSLIFGSLIYSIFS